MSVPVPSDGLQHLVMPRTSLIGRDEEAERVADLLLAPDVSLVTVVGPGGAGKTRLALKLLGDLRDSFRDGVWFVPLTTIGEARLVLPTIAQTIGIREDGDGVETRLQERLRDTEMLVVLDNFEHVREAAVAISRLLQGCRDLRVLVTSRVILHLSSEHVYPIAGLPLPDEDNSVSLDVASRNPAIQLFVTRAQSSDPAFQLTEQNVEAVVGVLCQLDGLPLGIELAAARVRTLSPQALHARLSRRLTVLGSRFHDVPDRHRTIGDAIDWSVQLLTPAEREVFGRLAVFGAIFSLSAAEAVVGDLEQNVDVLDALGALVDQSLLVHVSSPSDDEPRFRMLRVVRETAQQVLEAGDADAAHRSHAEHFLALAETAAPHLTGPEQVRWLNELERSLVDLRAAMAWFEQAGEHLSRLRLAVALWRFGYVRGHLTESREWLRFALEANPEPTPYRAAALNAKGLLASSQGDSKRARDAHEEALALFRDMNDDAGVAAAFNGLGDAAAVAGDRVLAREWYEAALERYRALGDVRGIAGALTNIGNLVWDERDFERAVKVHQQALVQYREAGDLRGMAWSASNLGTLAIQLGQVDAGTEYLTDAIEKYTALDDPYGFMLSLEGLTEIAHARGQADVEARLFGAAAAIRERIGMPVSQSDRPRYDAEIERIRAALGGAFDALWAAGKAMNHEEAIELAVRSASEAPPPVAPASPVEVADTWGLTRRELEVIRLIAAGKTNKEISDELSISYRTVSTHVSNMLGKLVLANRSALASFAHREGLA